MLLYNRSDLRRSIFNYSTDYRPNNAILRMETPEEFRRDWVENAKLSSDRKVKIKIKGMPLFNMLSNAENYGIDEKLKKNISKMSYDAMKIVLEFLGPCQLWEYMALLDVPGDITSDMTTFTKDPAPIERRRDEVARAIATLYKF